MRPPEQPTVAVIIAAYNAAKSLPAAVASVHAQTFANWEIVVVDDDSTDATPRVLRRLAAGEPRLTAIRLARNSGSAAARNVAWRAARARWIAVLDADDAWHPEKLEQQLAALAARPDALWSFHGVRYVRDGQTLHDWCPDPDADLAEAILRSDHHVVHTSVLYRRDALASLGGFDVGLRRSQDWDLFVRLATDHPGTAVVMPDVLADYTVRAIVLSPRAVEHGLRGQRRVVRQRLLRGGWALKHPKLAYAAIDGYVDRAVEWTGGLGWGGRCRWWAAAAVLLAPWRRWRWRRWLTGTKKPPLEGSGG